MNARPQISSTAPAGTPTYPRRLIEVDLPIRAISAHARREKSIHHGNISTLHIWWARRPLASCRAVICAALWPDPADDLCPQSFRDAASEALASFAEQVRTDTKLAGLVKNHWSRWNRTNTESLRPGDPAVWPDMRYALLDFIADFANWDASTVPAFLDAARALTEAAHEALGGESNTRPLVLDPFAGGGSIPLEALRVGADSFASDLNPIAVLLNKIVLEYVPRYGQQLIEAVRKWGEVVRKHAEEELAEFYPRDPTGSTPIAYLWARTIRCEGPGCGVHIPLIRNMQITRDNRLWHYAVDVVDRPSINILVREGEIARDRATVAGGRVTCPRPECQYTTPAKAVREQLAKKAGGSRDAMLLAVYLESPEGRYFRSPTEADKRAASRAVAALEAHTLPKDAINPQRPYTNTRGLSAVTRIGMVTFTDLYTARQILAIECFRRQVIAIQDEHLSEHFREAVVSTLMCAASRFIFQNCSLSRWNSSRSTIEGAFGKQALQIVWDFAESNPLSNGPANWNGAVSWVLRVIEANACIETPASVARGAAQNQLLPDDAAQALITDPPYFAAIPYSDLSNVFYVWEREFFQAVHPELFNGNLVDQRDEIIVTNANVDRDGNAKTPDYYRREMQRALEVARRIVVPSGVGVIVFADSTPESWEAILSAVIGSGWVITSSWPIDTELQSRTQAAKSASLQSSIHIVCRPRESPDGSISEDLVGDWRDVLGELPIRIRSWLPRLAREGVVGADAIFSCLGPALEIFSRYARVEKTNGDQVELREYLEHVWGAVSREALSMIFEEADVTGFEEDARLTAMWLWTLRTGSDVAATHASGLEAGADADEEEVAEDGRTGVGKIAGYQLEFDSARKIAQGIGARLDELSGLVEIKGGRARLIPVRERMRGLFGKGGVEEKESRQSRRQQLSLFTDHDTRESELVSSAGDAEFTPGATALDRVHQAMLLFAFAQGGDLRRFLVDEGAGADQQFWRLAQALSALYPTHSEEKRWVDGVLARKRALGL